MSEGAPEAGEARKRRVLSNDRLGTVFKFANDIQK